MGRLKRKLYFDEAKKVVIDILLKHRVIKQSVIEKFSTIKKHNFGFKEKK